MKVDMSPEAVTQRLKLMDELWILSMKLMDAGKKLRLQKRRAGHHNAEVKGSKAS
jgi:hypothetical protein